MEYLYHVVPKDMVGSQLIPLNNLKESQPEIYKKEIAKYNDHPQRKRLPNTKIPKLDCLWNDVVQLCPIHPNMIYQGWLYVGKTITRSLQFFQIPITEIQDKPTAIYHYYPDHTVGTPFKDKNFELIRVEDYKELTALPNKTLKWYQLLHEEGKFGAHFHAMPHIMVKGNVNISHSRIIDWKESPVI